MKQWLSLVLLTGYVLVGQLNAQSIAITRIGVTPDKDHFVTATQSFTLEIRLANVTQCSGVSFELQFSDARNVRFAGSWTALDFPASNVVVVDNSNYVTGIGSVTVIAMLGGPPSAGGLDDPAVVQLDFIVPPDAIHNANIVFSFRNAEAVVAAGGGTVVRLTGEPALYNVHGYIDVWPGDANNDGIVDSRDGTVIALFYDEGGAGSRIRGFPRKPASAVWAAQPALAWDSVRVTYADCDGSGRVDINDVLVIYANFSKTHSKTTRSEPILQGFVTEFESFPQSRESQWIPIELHTGTTAMGVAARISWAAVQSYYRVIGVQRGTIFEPTKGFFAKINEEEAYCDIAVGNLYPDPEVPIDGILAYLIVEPKTDNPPPFVFKILKLNGIRRNGSFFPLILTSVSPITNTIPNTSLQRAGHTSQFLITGLQSGEHIRTVQCYNSRGQRILLFSSASRSFALPPNLPAGIYGIQVTTNRRTYWFTLPLLNP